jgi:prepilin-type N-terminal cleavage/methylation domain-containing protein
MNSGSHAGSSRGGFTLIELSLVLFILIALLSFGFGLSGAITKWKLGRAGSEILRSAYTAQRTYLADHPTTSVNTLTQAMLLPYLPNGPAAFPTCTSLTNTQLFVQVNVSPPVLTATAGGTAGPAYDPSGNTKDSLWDVGE